MQNALRESIIAELTVVSRTTAVSQTGAVLDEGIARKIRRVGRAAQPARQPTVLDLFSGAGGLSLGFESAGFRIVGGIDFSESAVATFRRNFRNAVSLKRDIRSLSGDQIRAAIGCEVDVLVGGPSCQGFSTSGGLAKTAGRDLNDPRNSLFEHYLRLVRELDPAWIVFENVPGLLLYNHGEVARTIASRFNEMGYKVQPIILLAADYGVPQLRRRLFFVGNRTESPVHFPLPTHGNPDLWAKFSLPFSHLSRLGHKAAQNALPHVTFKEACGDLPPLREGQSIECAPHRKVRRTAFQKAMKKRTRTVRQHTAFDLSETDRVAARLLRQGENWTNIPEGLLPARFAKIRRYDATTLMKRLSADKPAYTITTKFHEASTGAFIHPTQRRTLSLREAARLQSFPDSFIFDGSARDIRDQIGNAVPPLLARAVAEGIYAPVVLDVFGVETDPLRETLVADVGFNDAIRLHKARKHVKSYPRLRASDPVPV